MLCLCIPSGIVAQVQEVLSTRSQSSFQTFTTLCELQFASVMREFNPDDCSRRLQGINHLHTVLLQENKIVKCMK